MPKSQKKKSPINRSIIIGCTALTVVLSLLLAYQTYVGVSNALYSQYNARLRDVIVSLEHETDVDDLRECMRTRTSSPKRDELQRRINLMVDDYELEFLYIVLPVDSASGEMYSIISSTSEAERLAGDGEDWPIFYDCSEDYTREEMQAYIDAMQNPGISYFEESSEWGHCYTACKPLITSDGEAIALLCADYSINDLRGEIANHVIGGVVLIVCTCAVFGTLLALWLRKNVTAPIRTLEQSALRFARMTREVKDIEELSFDAEDLKGSGEVSMLIDAMIKLSQEMKNQAEDAAFVKDYAKEMEAENQRLTEKAEAAIKIAELTQSVTSLLTNMPGMTFSKDVKTKKYLACNQAFAEFAHKKNPEAVVGLTDHQIFDKDTADHFVADDTKALGMDEPYVIYEDVTDAAGNPRQFQTTKLKFTDPTGRLCLLGMSIDFTELMHTKEETIKAKEAYEKARSDSTMYAHIVRALSANYSLLYFVDMYTNDYIEYQSNGEANDATQERQGSDFFNNVFRDAQKRLYPDDLPGFLEMFTKENILRSLDERGEFTLSYRLMVDGEPTLMSMKITYMQGDERRLIIGVKKVNLDARNELTGLCNEAIFHVRGKEILREHPEGWCLIAIDIENFKLFNEWYGRETGDKLLARIGKRLSVSEEKYGALAAYMGQDDFCLLAPYHDERTRRLYHDIHAMVAEYGTSVGFMPAFGMCMADGESGLEELYDHAVIAGRHAKENFHTRIRTFEVSMIQQTERDYHILSDFQKALREHELFINLQPQCRIDTGKVVGAESLVRWRKADGQMVSPGIFVPVLERYGFVTDLDKFVWEEVCAWQRRWIDGGHTPLPVSVNVSQIDIFSIDVPEYMDSLIKKYDLPVDVVKVEITESAYVGDGAVVDTVKRLREKGFLVLMDDFGSGYSSLNMLRNLNVDIIKLDAQFLRMSDDDHKGVHILESIVNMAKTMGVPIIVEGVETREETDFIASLGCRYVQGYYFYKPMPVPDFEELIGDPEHIDTDGFVFKVKAEFHTREFLDQNVFSDVMLNNILGPVAFFQLHGEDFDCIRYNEQFYHEINSDQFDSLLKSAQRLLSEDDLPVFYGLLEQAMNDPLNGAADILRFPRADGTVAQFRAQFFFLDEDENGKRFYGSMRDVTQLDKLNSQMRMITRLSNDEVIFVRKRESGLIYQVTVHGLEEALGISREEFEQELNSGEVQKRVSEETVNMVVSTAYGADMKMADYSPVFSMKGAGGKDISLRFRIDSVQDKSSGVDYLLVIHRVGN